MFANRQTGDTLACKSTQPQWVERPTFLRTPNVFVRCHSISKSSSEVPNRGFPDPWGSETRFWGVRNANFECEFVHSWM